jgi:hypothetical protein
MHPLILATVLTLFGLTGAFAEAGRKHATTAPPSLSANPVPKQFKAICRSKVVKVQTDRWMELRKRQRCYTAS